MSVELQTAFQVTAPSGGLDGHMLLILAAFSAVPPIIFWPTGRGRRLEESG